MTRSARVLKHDSRLSSCIRIDLFAFYITPIGSSPSLSLFCLVEKERERESFLSLSFSLSSVRFFIFVDCYCDINCCSTITSTFIFLGLCLDSSSTEKDRPISTRALSIHDIGTSGTSTGITNSIYKTSINDEQADVLLDSSPSIQLSLTKTTNGKGAEEDIMQREQQSGPSLAETQFYARTTPTPVSKRHALIFQKSEEIYSTPPLEPTFQDPIDHYKANSNRFIDDQSK